MTDIAMREHDRSHVAVEEVGKQFERLGAGAVVGFVGGKHLRVVLA